MRALFGIGVLDVPSLAEHVPDDVHIKANNTAAVAPGGFDLKVKMFHRTLAPYALRAVMLARRDRVRARARATNAAARCRAKVSVQARRPSSARTRRSRAARGASRAGPSSADGDGPDRSRAAFGVV